MDMLDKLKEYLDNATQEELQETYNKLSHLLCKNNSTIVERAVNVQHEFTPNRDWGDVAYGYERGATEQGEIDDKAMDMLNEACDNTIAILKEEHKRALSVLIDKACELFRKECQEANGLIKSVCDRNIGDLINVDSSVKTFRKKLEE